MPYATGPKPDLSVAEVLCIALAGLAAGTINTVVGSGTLITFPVLLAFGYAPVTANVYAAASVPVSAVRIVALDAEGRMLFAVPK